MSFLIDEVSFMFLKSFKLLVAQDIDYPAWIGAIAALIGVPLSLVSLIKLVRRDKDREQKIDKLASIAAVLEGQTDAILKQNELIAQQVDIFRNTAVLQGNDQQALEKLQLIEEKRLRLSVQPRLWLNGAGYRGNEGELKIDLNNKGEVAYIDDIDLEAGDIILHNKHVPYTLEKGERRYIFGRTSGAKYIKDCTYRIIVAYHNALNQQYKAIIEGEGSKAKIVSDQAIN